MKHRVSGLAFAALMMLAATVRGDDTFQWSGFTFVRATSAPSSGPLEADALAAQLHVGLDWTPTPFFNAHLGLLARDREDGTLRGVAGVTEAWAEANFRPGGDRVRVRAGAMFLPTSRENVDALWETAYTLTPSALNSWLGEEFRPIGIDVGYFRYGFFGGATIFRGNDTFGALPPVRGWKMRDHWILLGEWIDVDGEYYTSASAETDGTLGLSGRAGWNGQNVFVQYTHIDNRSDALEYGRLANWDTQFDIAAAEYSTDEWTVATEYGWGPTAIINEETGFRYVADISAGYILASRRLGRSRATVRVDVFDDGSRTDEAFTASYFFSGPRGFRPGIEVITSDGEVRASAEVRYSFSK